MSAPAVVSSSYLRMVEALTAQGVPLERAQARARELCNDAPPLAGEEPERDARVLEGKEQAEVYKLFRGFGCEVYNLSQARASKQAPGLGDAWVVHRSLPLAWWWETKRQVGGELSAAQERMRDNCLRCGIAYYSGDRYKAAALLVHLGIAVRGEGPHGIVPAPRGP